jgi:hypothetical protein
MVRINTYITRGVTKEAALEKLKKLMPFFFVLMMGC